MFLSYLFQLFPLTYQFGYEFQLVTCTHLTWSSIMGVWTLHTEFIANEGTDLIPV